MGLFSAFQVDVTKDIRSDEKLLGQWKDIQCNVIAGKDDKNVFGKEIFAEKRTGILVITDKRIFFKSKKGMADDIISLATNQISNVDIKKSMITSEITIYSSSGSRLELTRIFNQMIDEVTDCLSKAQAAPAPIAAASSSTPDIPDQIKKLSKLKDEGILTAEEFEKKKAELLSKI